MADYAYKSLLKTQFGKKKMYVANVYVISSVKTHWHCRLQSVQCENFGVTYRFYIFIV